MNWRLVFQLSLLGLIMAFGTISLIPDKVEPFFWLVIFLMVAYLIAKACSSKYFLHGFFVSIFNSVYLTATHTIFLKTYDTHHPGMVVKLHDAPQYTIPVMIAIGIGSGIGFGLVQGLFAVVASKLVKKAPVK
jgi:hypothetical protein